MSAVDSPALVAVLRRDALNPGNCASYALAKARGVPLLFKGNDVRRTDLTPAA